MAQKEITISIGKKDFDKLNKYGFDFNRNVSEYLHDIAEQLSAAEKEQKIKKKDPFKKVVAVYTGGGVWLFYGELKSGEYFLTDDNGYIQVLDSSPENLDESLYEEWQEEHFLRVVGTHKEEKTFLHSLLDRLGRNLPEDDGGGIDDYELKRYREDWDNDYKLNWGCNYVNIY